VGGTRLTRNLPAGPRIVLVERNPAREQTLGSTVTDTPEPDQDAIARLRRGDAAGLEPLVRRYQLQALRAAYLVLRDHTLAQDVVQSAFVGAFERIHQFDTSRPFGPWFLKLVLNSALKAASRRGRETRLDAWPSVEPVEPALGPELAWERAETADQVWAALAQLSPVQRVAIVQRYFLELTEHEMTTALGCPPSTIKARLHAARHRLRALLRPTGPASETTP